jgi:chaperone modulatory protein CbpM
MVERETVIGVAWVLDDEPALRLADFCEATGTALPLVVEMVAEGILEPRGTSQDDWRFSGLSLARARCALRLHRDLGLDWHAIAFALPLLEELQSLRRRHRALLRRLGG